MTTHLLWIAGPRGPMPTRCDDESIATVRKYQRISAEHVLSNDVSAASLDVLARMFPPPEASDADQR